MIQPKNAAFILIDMQKGFIEPTSVLCVAGAAATVTACAHALSAARKAGMEVYIVRREYAPDGHDVEPVRHEAWLRGGRPLCSEGDDPSTLDAPDLLTAADGDRVVLKPSFSAFFGTALHEHLQAGGVTTVVLAGTTTPNCVRSTCYDALSLGYNVVILEDATSSRTPEVQAANIEDMRFIGAHIMRVEEFCAQGLENVRDVAAEAACAVRAARADRSARGRKEEGAMAGTMKEDAASAEEAAATTTARDGATEAAALAQMSALSHAANATQHHNEQNMVCTAEGTADAPRAAAPALPPRPSAAGTSRRPGGMPKPPAGPKAVRSL